MCACIAQLKPQQQVNMSKLLASWRSEQVVPGSIIAACEAKLPALAEAAAAAAAADQQQHSASPPPQGQAAAANGGYRGASDYVQAMAAAAVAAAAQAAAQQGKQQLTPAKRVRGVCGAGAACRH